MQKLSGTTSQKFITYSHSEAFSYVMQAPQSPAVQETSVQVDTSTGLDGRVFSTGDINTEMVERTMSNLSAMSSDSTADSAADSVDVSPLYCCLKFSGNTTLNILFAGLFTATCGPGCS